MAVGGPSRPSAVLVLAADCPTTGAYVHLNTWAVIQLRDEYISVPLHCLFSYHAG